MLFPQPAARFAQLPRQPRSVCCWRRAAPATGWHSWSSCRSRGAIRGWRSPSGLFAPGHRASWFMAQFDINLSSFDVFWTNALQGFGFGLAYTPMTRAARPSPPCRRTSFTEASGVFTLCAQFRALAKSSRSSSCCWCARPRPTIRGLTEFINSVQQGAGFPRACRRVRNTSRAQAGLMAAGSRDPPTRRQ